MKQGKRVLRGNDVQEDDSGIIGLVESREATPYQSVWDKRGARGRDCSESGVGS